MSFMAGFGSAFADSFNQQERITAAHKEDVFRLRYQDYVSRRDEQVKTDKENAKMAKAAKSIAAMTGQPAEAWGTFYDQLQGGASFDDVVKMAQSNQAVVQPNSPTTQPGEGATASDQPADPRDNLTQGAASSVDAQMRQSGMTPPAEGGIFGNVKSQLHNVLGGNSQERAARDQARADQEISNTTGDSPEQVQNTFKPRDTSGGDDVPGRPDVKIKWTPKNAGGGIPLKNVNNSNDALAYKLWADQFGTPQEQAYAKNQLEQFQHADATKAHAAGVAAGTAFEFSRAAIKGPNGKWDGGIARPEDDGNGGIIWKDAQGQPVDQSMIKPFDKNMETDIKLQETALRPDIQKYQQNVTDYKSLARTSSQLTALSKKYPEAMGMSGDISQYSDALKRAGVNVLRIVNPKLDPEGKVIPDDGALGEAEKAEKAVEGMMKNTLDRNSQNALAATLIDIKATRLAYMWAKDMGQRGNGVSNADFNNFKNAAKGNENPEGLAISAADFLSEKYRGLKDQEAMINSDTSGMAFEQKYGIPSPFKLPNSIDDQIASDPELKTAVDQFNDTMQNNSLTKDGNQTQVPGDWTAIGKTPDGRIVYQTPDGKQKVGKK